MTLLARSLLSEMSAHGRDAYPYECCGAMLGGRDRDGQATVERLVRLDNVSGEDQRRRFFVSPDDYRSAEAEADDAGVALLGFYHSHPDHPAQPSTTDRDYAWPFFIYIIISIEKQEYRDIGTFTLDTGSGEFVSEDLTISD